MPHEFNGSTLYAGVSFYSSPSTAPGPNGGTTLAFWFTTTLSGNQQLITSYNLSNPGTRFCRHSITSGALSTSMQGSTGSATFSHGSISTNTWYCAVIRLVGMTSRNMWLSGQSSATSNTSTVIYSGATASQNRMSFAGTNAGASFSGKLAHVTVWAGILTDA